MIFSHSAMALPAFITIRHSIRNRVSDVSLGSTASLSASAREVRFALNNYRTSGHS
jgi:hypothetical protein